MKEIKVFIAGAKTLSQLRDSARAALMEISNQYRNLNVMYRSYTFEDFPRSCSVDGRQADYNHFIRNQADYVIFIFDEGFGDITLQEFDVAMQGLIENSHPQIYVYCNEAKMNCDKFKEIQRKLNDYGQYYIAYEEGHFKEQLKSDFTYVLVNSCNITQTSIVKGSRLEGSVSISEKSKPVVQECFQSRKKNDGTLTTQVGNIQFDMIRVEGGQLEIGATDEQEPFAEKNEYPAHSVDLPTFYIGQFPVTQNLWEKVMGYNHSYNQQSEKELVFDLERKKVQAAVMNAMNPTASSINNMDTDYGHYPVENLSYNEAIQFVRRLSELTDLKFDLPTEEEWEYAARGGQKSRHYRYAGSNNIEEVAWYRHNSSLRTHPVGEKQPNELGIYDMSGNVWEWTKSKAHRYGIDVSSEDKMLIRRGGSAIHVDKNCRISFRYETERSKHNMGSGLRVVIREYIDK